MKKKGQAASRPIMTDAGIKAKTGKDWAYWFAALDKAGAKKLDHKGIVGVLSRKMQIGPWWRQMIAVSYERARGLRATNQKGDGVFSVGVSKMMEVDLVDLFSTATAEQRKWFPRGIFQETSRTTDKYWRGTWKKDGRLEINFYAKTPGKAQIVIQSDKLASSAAVEAERTAWKKALEKLRSIVSK